MNKIQLLSSITKLTAKIADVQLRRQAKKVNRKVCEQIHLKQVDQTERDIQSNLEPFFTEQIKDVKTQLRKSDSDFIPPANQIYNPRDWDQDLIQSMVDPLSRAYAKAYTSQITVMGAEKSIQSTRMKMIDPEYTLETPYGQIDIGVLTEYPEWLKRTIRDNLQETFNQPYWANVNNTTLGDIDKILTEGLGEGWSLRNLVNEISDQLLEEGRYATRRARMIAQTESTTALNASRAQAIQSLSDTLPEQAKPRMVWMSVLKDTTRATHADLDGVPANAENRWVLAGYTVRWPGDVVLPPEERINCYCSVQASFGIQQMEANQLIQEYEDRISLRGGPGSGNWGHSGRPGMVGGSSPTGGGIKPPNAPGNPNPPSQDVFGRSRAKVEITTGGNVTQEWVDQSIENHLGKNAKIEDIASMVGAPDGAKVELTAGFVPEDMREHFGELHGKLSVTVKGAGYQALRTIGRDDKGELVVKNEFFEVSKDKQGSGLGMEIFGRQVEQASKLGISRIDTQAAGDYSQIDKWNGYYTWPRLGYDGAIPSHVGSKLPTKFKKAKNVSDLMKTKDGRDWWKKNGDEVELSFDLSKDSQSQRVLKSYLGAKGIRK